MVLVIHPAGHLDHGLTVAQLAFILDQFVLAKEFGIHQITLPDELGTVESALYGPLAGDEPVAEGDVHYAVRGSRKGKSRLVNRPTRQTNQMVVVCGPHDGFDCILYTAYGGPKGAPKEPWDCAEGPEREAAEKFWSEHALAL